MSRLSVDVTDNKTFVTVSETNNSVTIDRSDNPISVENVFDSYWRRSAK